MGTESSHLDATQQAATFLGAAFARPSFAGLGVRGLGAAVALSQLIARKFESTSQTTVPTSAAIDELSSRGLDRTEAERCLDSLAKRGVIEVSEGCLSISLLSEHLTRDPAQPNDVALVAAPAVEEAAPLARKLPAQRVKAVEGVRRLRLCDAGEPEGTPVVASLMTKDGGFVDVTQGYADKLAARYMKVDVIQELLKAEHWCEANTANRKTFNGMASFLARWFGSAVVAARALDQASRAQRGKNAFGHGGYAEQPAAPAPEASAPDDLDDLVAPPAAPKAVTAATSSTTPLAPAAAPSTVNRLAAALAAKRAARAGGAGQSAGKGAL